MASAADLVLDTGQYNGGATALDAAWAGAPSLSLVGEKAVQRMGHSTARALGFALPLSVRTPREYEDTGVRMCGVSLLAWRQRSAAPNR